MIITERFVMLNFPKTGSSFARMVIKRLYKQYDAALYRWFMKLGLAETRGLLELRMPAIDSQAMMGRNNQHGTYRQIPPEHLHKKIFTIVRNPLDRYVSSYLFRWWQKYPLASMEQLCAVWPHFPNLSFAEFYDMFHRFGREERLHGVRLKTDLGRSTIQFIQFYFPDPARVLELLDDAYIEEARYRDDMANITFLHQENLNQELYDFLLGLGYPARQLDFIRHAEKLNITPRTEDQKKLRDFYTPALVEQIYARDKLLFDIFPEYRNFVF